MLAVQNTHAVYENRAVSVEFTTNIAAKCFCKLATTTTIKKSCKLSHAECVYMNIVREWC